VLNFELTQQGSALRSGQIRFDDELGSDADCIQTRQERSGSVVLVWR
jgi:hypothetical protein